MKSKLIKRLLVFLALLLGLNILTLFTISKSELLPAVLEGYIAEGRLNSGTDLIIRDNVTGIAETGTMETFSSDDIRRLMEVLKENRRVRTVVYRPLPVSPDTLQHEPFELNMAVSSRGRYLLGNSTSIHFFGDGFSATHRYEAFWFFGWRN